MEILLISQSISRQILNCVFIGCRYSTPILGFGILADLLGIISIYDYFGRFISERVSGFFDLVYLIDSY